MGAGTHAYMPAVMRQTTSQLSCTHMTHAHNARTHARTHTIHARMRVHTSYAVSLCVMCCVLHRLYVGVGMLAFVCFALLCVVSLTDSMLALAEDHLNDIMSNVTAAGTAALASYVSIHTAHCIIRTRVRAHVCGSSASLERSNGTARSVCVCVCLNRRCRCPTGGGWTPWVVFSYRCSSCGGGWT